MFSSRSTTLLRSSLFLLISCCLYWLLSGSSLLAAARADVPPAPAAEAFFPEQLGTVVYQTRAAATSRIYIIANGHRSAINGAGTAKTLQAQMETFRIGEWLIKQNRIDLLLPEGFFGEMGRSGAIDAQTRRLDNQAIQDALADTTHFVNAELLLHEQYGIGLEQVEDRKLYRDVRDLLKANLQAGSKFSFARYNELAHLQKLRTAYLVQSAPMVIAKAHQQGRVAAPNAMLTIGLSHLQDIIAFLETGKIDMAGWPIAGMAPPFQGSELELIRQHVGFTVIVPPALASNRFELAKQNIVGEEATLTR